MQAYALFTVAQRNQEMLRMSEKVPHIDFSRVQVDRQKTAWF